MNPWNISLRNPSILTSTAFFCCSLLLLIGCEEPPLFEDILRIQISPDKALGGIQLEVAYPQERARIRQDEARIDVSSTIRLEGGLQGGFVAAADRGGTIRLAVMKNEGLKKGTIVLRFWRRGAEPGGYKVTLRRAIHPDGSPSKPAIKLIEE